MSGNFEPRGVLFDIDGTLYHQRRLRLLMGAVLALRTLVRPLRTLREIRILRHFRRTQEELRRSRSAGVTPQLQAELAASAAGVSIEEVRRCVGYWMDRVPLMFLRMCARAEVLRRVRRWHRLGIPMGTYSDYPAGDKLKRLGVAELFRASVCSTDAEVGAFKPHPRGFEAAARRLGLPPGRIVYVGDRADIDAVGARRAGMRVVLVDRVLRDADRGDTTLADLDRRFREAAPKAT